ncbi:MAG: ATP-dependent Clp protease ATP-binding subunit ClpA [Peptococcaceae bacterium]|nr:ATP-dependent Clp protease ATP-binding subunit ClpA [Peptococcaceae bacterium]
MIEQELEISLHLAIDDARKKGHELFTVEHLLLALLDNPAAARALRACGADVDDLRRELTRFTDEHTPKVDNNEFDPPPTLGFERVLQRAILQAESSGKQEVDGAYMLVAIYSEEDSHAVYFLQQQDISLLDILSFISHGVTKTNYEEIGDLYDGQEQLTREVKTRQDVLQIYTHNINQQVLEGKIDPLIGRDKEIERVVQTLCRRRKNNPILVGEAGVGKTAVAEGLAHRIVGGLVPDILRNAQIYALDMGALLAGTKYRGDFEQRMKTVLKQLTDNKDAILFIDEIHTLIGAGATSDSTLDASNLLKPALAAGRLKCIGATTYTEYRQVFEKNHALSRRFQKIDIVEPTVAETVEILKGLKNHFEAHHGVRYSPGALTAAAELSARYINDRHLPDKAIDIIDEAGAAQRILPKSRQKKTIGKNEIENIVAKIARIPPRNISQDDRAALKTLDQDLKKVIFGQDAAIDTLVQAIKTARSGLGNPQKPIGCFLFSGPTGVGKTEVARQLAYTMGIELVRFDMSEYMERHAVSRLIGAPPGYVGFDQGGLLTEQIVKKPYSVVLLDEIEKAHPDIYNILLQIMDHGTLTDNNGRQADFRNVILIMTTNAGAEAMQKTIMGFSAKRETGDEMSEIKRVFTPEFRNRLDGMISFKSLDNEIILRVVDKFLAQLESQLNEKNVTACFTDTLKTWLAQKGFDPAMGARPMARLIQDVIRAALADELLFGRLAKGGEVTIDVDPDCESVKLVFEGES